MSALGVDQLVAQIIANIYQNTANDITGQELQDQLVDVVDSLSQGLYNNLIPYKIGQSVIIDDGGTNKLYICVTNTTAGESPITTPAKWDFTSGSAGVVLDYIVLSIAALKAITGYSNDNQTLVNDNNGLYGFDSTSTTSGDDDLVVTPDDITEPAPGRWLKIKTLVDTTTTGVLGDLISPITTNLVAAINGMIVNSIEIVTNITALKAIPLNRREYKTIIVTYYDEGDEGAVSGGVKKILFYKGPDLTNTEWEDLGNWFGLESVLLAGFTTTAINLEGFPPGTVIPVDRSFEALWNSLLAPYLPSAISGSTIQETPSGSTFEVGATVQVDSITIAVVNDSAGNPPTTLNIAGTGYNVAGSVGVNTPPSPPLNIQQTTDTNEVWSITGTDANSDPINQEDVEINWYFRHFVGANNTELTGSSTPAEVKAVLDVLQNKVLRTGKAAEITASSVYNTDGYFTYIAYATKYSDLNNVIMNSGSSVFGAFTKLGDFSYTNAEAHVESYSVYKSNASGAFENGDEINIS